MPNKQTTTISFEFFPPKTQEGIDNLDVAAKILSKLEPDHFSVTFGAGGSTLNGTVETVKKLKKKTETLVVPHLSCIGGTRQELVDMLHTYQSMNINRLYALRGDLPSGMVQGGDFQYATDLIELIRDVTGNHFYIYVAAYPEIHPQAKDPNSDVLNLKRKFEAGANCAVTQYFFNPDAYFYYLDDCARHNISMPVVPGIMPITQFTRLARFSDNCGAEIPLWIRKRLASFGDDTDAIASFGTEVVYHLCERLLSGGAPGLHFYTLNKADAAMKIIKLLNLQSAKVMS